jgi:hypothetical protein
MVGTIDAQTWLNEEINKGNIDKNTSYEIYSIASGSGITTPLTPGAPRLKLNGELRIEEFLKLEELDLTDAKELDKLVVKNCPNLKEINIPGSGVKELELGPGLDDLLSLNFSFDVSAGPASRKLDELDLSNVPNLKILHCFGVHETKLKGVEKLTQLQFFSSGTSLVDKTVVLLPTNIFREWKEGIKEVLGITDVDLPDDWHTNLTNKLGGANLDQMPTGKTLKDLIDAFSTDKDDLQKKLDQVQEELDKQKDYEEVKQEQDQLKQQLEAIKGELGLGNDAIQEQVLNKIKELKNTPPACSHTNYDAIKAEKNRLKTENERLKNENKENRDVITKKVLREKKDSLFKELNFSSNEIKSAASVFQLEEASNKVITQEFGKLKDESNSSFNLNIGLGVLTIGSWLISGWVVMRQVNLPKVEPKKGKSG